MKVWRHGDLIIVQSMVLPEGAKKRHSPVLVKGELTGHMHQILEPQSAQIWEAQDGLYIQVINKQACIVHEEHKPIMLGEGIYKFWVQREYTPNEVRHILD